MPGVTRITSLELGDDEQFDAFYATYRASYDRDFDQPYTARDKRVGLRDDGYESHVGLLAHDDGGALVGAGWITLPLRDNLDFAYIELFVLPSRRREGHGRALLEALLAASAERGRRTVLGEAAWPVGVTDAPAREFAEASGFELDILDAHRELLLPAEGLPALVVAPGYRVRSWRGTCPEEWVEEYADVRRLLVQEAPSGDAGLENEFWDATRVRHEEERWAEQRRTPQVSVALTEAGALVGHTQLLFPGDSDEVYQWDTLVLPAHRGHGLGLALKVHTMHESADLLAGRRRIHTYNAASNAPMIRVNEALGFRQVAWVGEYVRTV